MELNENEYSIFSGDLRNMNRRLAPLLLVTLLLCAPAAYAGERAFEATSFEYNVNASPQISSRKFGCKVDYFKEGFVKIVQIKNFINKKSDPDVIVKIVSSNDSAASMLYNSKMEIVTEYPRGKFVNENLFTFTGGDNNRQIAGSWFTDPDFLMSDFTMRDDKGVLLYKETVIYTAKSPSR